jgi:excisionase family DNA binding protein
MPDRRSQTGLQQSEGTANGPLERGTEGRGRLLTAEEVAEILGVTPAWVYEQSRAGRIPTVTLGRYRRYRREAITAWLEQLERGATLPRTEGENGRRGGLDGAEARASRRR